MRFLAMAPPAVALLLVTASSGLPADRTTGFVDVPKGRLWYEAAGAGPALVLIHDGLLPSETWAAQVEPFDAHNEAARVRLLDLLRRSPFSAAGGSPETSFYDGGLFGPGSGAPREERHTFLLRALAR